MNYGEYIREKYKTPQGKKEVIIKRWKTRGLIEEDYDKIYEDYQNATNCQECDVVFGSFGDKSGTYKVMDHCHTTGKFRNYLCVGCNTRRG